VDKQVLDIFGENQLNDQDSQTLFRIVFNLPINWVGNKKRLLNRLLSFMNEHQVEYNSFFDVFAGSGVVSVLAAASEKKVFSNDLLMLSSTWVLNLLSSNRQILSNKEASDLLNIVKTKIRDPSQVGFLSELYGGALLIKSEVAYLDAYRRTVSELFGSKMMIGNRLNQGLYAMSYLDLNDGKIGFNPGTGNPQKVTFAMQMMCVHILQQAFMGGRCYKSQLLAISEKRLKSGKDGKNGNSNDIGNENYLMKLLYPKTSPTNEIGWFLSDKKFESTVFNCDAETIISSETFSADIAYFDPPYGGYNSDYAWMYRVCEEFLTGTRLEESEELREASVKFKGSDYERDKVFAKKERKGYTDNFSTLLNKSSRFPIWMISFNESSFASIETIADIVASFRPDMVIETVDGYRYNYRKQNEKAGSEYIILARK
jgi:adenine-specific DNA methylase